jgi:hypothetical protein
LGRGKGILITGKVPNVPTSKVEQILEKLNATLGRGKGILITGKVPNVPY